MAQIKKILFYINGASGVEADLDRVAAMARSSEAALTLVDVLDGIPRDLLMLVPSVGAEALEELAVVEASAPLQALAEHAIQQGALASAKVLLGKPSSALIQEVERGRHDLLILNAKRKAGLKEKALGGNAVQLMRKCPCPVLVMRPAKAERSGRVLAAIAPEIGDEKRNASSAAVLDTAATLARAEGSKLHIAHFWNLASEMLLTRQLPRYQTVGLFRGARNAAREAVEEILGRVDLSAISYTVHLRKGQPSTLIPELADRMRVDLLVMGAPIRSGIAGFLAGNLAEEVFWSVDCPVATVRSCSSPAPMDSRAA